MTKKHFTALAKIMKEELPERSNTPEYTLWLTLVENITQYCQQQNPRFDRDVFYWNCGIQPRY